MFKRHKVNFIKAFPFFGVVEKPLKVKINYERKIFSKETSGSCLPAPQMRLMIYVYMKGWKQNGKKNSPGLKVNYKLTFKCAEGQLISCTLLLLISDAWQQKPPRIAIVHQSACSGLLQVVILEDN